MQTISTCEEFIDFISSNETEAELINDIDFAEYGQITSQHLIPASIQKTVEMNSYSVLNIYPILCCMISTYNAAAGSVNSLTYKNGFFKNVLLDNGIIANSGIYNNASDITYQELFTLNRFRIKFVNVGFSLLGCDYYDASVYNASVLASSSPLYARNIAYIFERCSIYVKSYNTLPMTVATVFKNCSLYFDCEYDTISSNTNSDSDTAIHKNTVFYYCVMKGKMKKSDKFHSDNAVKTLGETVNCYIDIETDIPNIFIDVDVTKSSAYYNDLFGDALNTDISTLGFGGTSVYNADKYTATVIEEGQNNQLIIGGQALSNEQMHDADYLLRCGFLAVDEGDEDV